MWIVAAVFAGVIAIIVGAYWVAELRVEEREDADLRKRLTSQQVVVKEAIVKRDEALSVVVPLNRLLVRRRPMFEPIARALHQSGLPINIGAVVLAIVFLALVAAAVGLWLRLPLLWTVGAAAVSACLPVLFIRHAARRRLARFEESFPDAIDLMARALRAGHALSTAIEMAADEMPDPIGGELRQVFEQQNYGLSLPDALKALAARVPILDVRFFVTAVLTQRESGGNLAEVLDNLANVIRERFKVKRQVRVISAHGRITGWVLGFLPPVIAVLLFIISPTHMRLLIDDPLGLDMLLIAIGLQIVGVLFVRRIVNIEY